MRVGFQAAPTMTKDSESKKFYERLIWLEPALVLMLAPVFLFPSPRRSLFFLILPLVFVFHFIARKRCVEHSPANWPLYLLLVMVAVSLYATYDIRFSLPKVAGVLLGIAIYFAIINRVDSQRQLALLLGVFLAGSLVLSAMGIFGTHWEQKVPVLGTVTAHLMPRIKGIPGAEEGFNPNAVAGGLILFIPSQISLFFSLRHNNKKFVLPLLGSLAITIGIVLLAQSRGSWMGLAVGVILLFGWMFRWGRWLAIAALLAGSILIFGVGPGKIGDSLMIGMGGSSSVTPSVEGRLEVWNRAIDGISDFPFTGMGMNTFRKVVHVLYPLFLLSPDADIASCHNQLLQTALDLGIPGLIAYVALLATAITMGIMVWRRSSVPWIRASAQGLACGILAQQIFCFTDAIPLGAKVGIFFWIALGALAAMYRLTTEKLNHEDL
jgi:putative inorganic carbon (hco3(-)) transporter